LEHITNVSEFDMMRFRKIKEPSLDVSIGLMIVKLKHQTVKHADYFDGTEKAASTKWRKL
jgi:hypothetical protein